MVLLVSFQILQGLRSPFRLVTVLAKRGTLSTVYPHLQDMYALKRFAGLGSRGVHSLRAFTSVTSESEFYLEFLNGDSKGKLHFFYF